MNLGKKLRSLGNKLHFPLVTRKRFNTLEANMEAEIKYITSVADSRALALRGQRIQIDDLKEQLAAAQRNDHRDPETGRFEKADARTFPDGSKVPDGFTDRPTEAPSQDSAGATAGLVA